MTKFVRKRWTNGIHTSTAKKYNGDMRLFLEFAQVCGMGDGEFIPEPNEEVMIFFCGWLEMVKGQSADTVKGTLSGFKSELKKLKLRDPTKDSLGQPLQNLARLNRGSKRTSNPAQGKKPRKGLTTDMLQVCVQDIAVRDDLAPRDKINIASGMVMGVYGMLRIGEFTQPTQKKHDPALHASLGDLSLTAGVPMAEFNARNAKNDPFRKETVIKMYENKSVTCPYKHAKALLAEREGDAPDSPLFVMANGTFLTRAVLQKNMRISLQRCGFDPEEYASHSLRIGGATSLAASGNFDSDRIRVLGRWSSDCFLRYMRQTRAMYRDASMAMARIATVDWQTLDAKAFNPHGAE